MRSFADVVFTAAGLIIRISWMFLVFMQIYVFTDAFRRKRSRGSMISVSIQTAVGIIMFIALIDGSFIPDYLGYTRKYPAFVDLIYRLPWISILAALIILTVLSLAELRSGAIFEKEHLSAEAIKETVDLLPEGICFGDENGTVVFENVNMREWSCVLTEGGISSTDEFTDLLAKSGDEHNGSFIISSPDGRTFMFVCGKISVSGREYSQITASDITEKYRMTEKLRENNERLRGIQRQMKEFSSKAAELAMSEEMLKARISVHDEVGHVLIRLKYYLDDPGSTDENNLLSLVKTTNNILMSEAADLENTTGDAYEEAVLAAKDIGVSVGVHGEIPDDSELRGILGRAVRECSVNTVKHARGDRITLECTLDDRTYTMIFRNNGDPPKDVIRESGGLLSLRKTAEKAGGTMTVASDSGFTLTLKFPKNV